mmetsp:Transcript_13426/g.46472  ORF Transcript_13426/g.46472 Transcript_13426/m.46472 type:complete len:276 (+) Transcript_13426:204-1031(+)
MGDMYAYDAEPFQPPEPAEFYDTESCYRHLTTKTPARYSILQSKTPRFKEHALQAPAVYYNIDTMHKKGLERAIQDSNVKYAAVFSRTERWAKDRFSAAPDITYDTDALRFSTLARRIEKETPIKYANIRSPAPRFRPTSSSAAPDKVYETDQGQVKTLRRSVVESPIRYSTMRSRALRFRDAPSTTGGDLGPGTYDTPVPAEVQRYRRPTGQLSSFKSGVNRLNERGDPTKYLGSTWTPEHDSKMWHRKAFTFSQTKVSRPAYLPASLEEKGKK